MADLKIDAQEDDWLAPDPTPEITQEDDWLAPDPKPDPALAVENALDVKPEAALKRRQDAERLGLPIEAADADPDALDRAVRKKQTEDWLAGAPVASRMFAENPQLAREASDSAEKFSLIEQGIDVLQSFGAKAVDTPGMALRGLGEGYLAVGRSLVRPIDDVLDRAGMTDVKEALHGQLPWWLSPSEILRRPGQVIGTGSQAIDVAPEDQNFATDVGGALGQVSAQVTAAILSGGVTSATNALMLLGQGFEQSARDVREGGAEGTAQGDAATLAGGVITAATESAAQKALLKIIPENLRSRAARGLASFTTEAITEITEGVARNLANYALFSDDPILDEQTLYEGGVGGTAGALFSMVIPGRRAVQQIGAMDDVQKEAASSPLAQRDPAKAAEHLGAALREAGVEVYIPVEVLDTIAGNDPDAFYSNLGVADQVEAARQLGGDVKLTPETFAKNMLLDDAQYQAIREHIRFDPEAMTAAEAEALSEEIKAKPSDANGLTPETGSEEISTEGDEFSGEVELLHGSTGPMKGFTALSEVSDEQRYDGGGGVFGRYTYLDPSGRWFSTDNGALGLDELYKVKANFEKLFILRPDNVEALEKIVGKEALRSGPAISEALIAKGYDGISVSGFDEYVRNLTRENEEGDFELIKENERDLRGLTDEIQQDQVVAFSPEKSLTLGDRVAGFSDTEPGEERKSRATEARKLGLETAKALPKIAGPKKAEQAKPAAAEAAPAGPRTPEGSIAADEAAVVAAEPVPAPPEIEEPVAFAEEQYGLQGLFTSAKEAGLTEPIYKEYLEKVAEAKDTSRKRQQMRLLKEQERETSAEYLIERKTVEAEMRERVALSEPVYAALNSTETQRLDREAVVRLIGKEGLEKLPKQAKGRAVFAPKREGGADPDALAGMYGFEDGEAMLAAMAEAAPFEQVVAERADAEMKKRYGTLMDKRQAVAAAIEELHNSDAQAQLLAYELAVLQQAKDAKAISVSTFREKAKEGLLQETVGDIHSAKYLQTERRWAALAGKLIRKNDRAGAAKAKYHQLLNYEYAREAFNLRRKTDKMARKLRKLQNPRKEHPGVAAEQMDAIRALLAGYDFSDKRTAKPGAATPYRSMTLNEFAELFETTATLWKQGTDARQVFRNGQLVEFAKVEEAILDRLKELPTIERSKRAKRDQNPRGFDATRSTLAGVRAKVAKVELLVRELDNGQVAGPVYDATIGEVHRARTKNLKMMRSQVGPVIDGLRGLSVEAQKRMGKSYFIRGLGREMLGSEIFMVALNAGSVSNLTKMIQGANKEEGRAQDWTPSGINEAISHLGREEGDLIQKIWNNFEAVRPQMEEIVRRKRGITPQRVQPRLVSIGGVQRTGGYFPMVYDPSRVSRDKVPTDAFEAMKDPFTLDNVFSGMTQARVEKYSAPVLLDIGALPHALEGHVHFISHFDAVDSINQVLDSPKIKRAIYDKLGEEYWKEFKEWIGAVATSNSQRGNLGQLGRLMNVAKTHVTVGYLGLSYGTLGAQALGLTTTVQQLGTDEKGNFSTSEGLLWLMSGIETFLSNPAKTTKEVRAASGLMEFRVENFDREIRSATNEIKSRSSRMWAKWGTAQRAVMQLIGTVQFYVVDMPTWLGAYNKAVAMGRSVEGAREFANSIVRTSQSSGLTEDLTALQRNKNPAMQWATMFSTYMALLFNLTLDTLRTGVRGAKKRDPQKVIGAVASLGVLLVATSFAEALMRREGPPEDEEDEAQWWALRVAAFAGGATPIAGSYISAGLKDFQGDFAKVSAAFNAVPKAIKSALKIFDPNEDVELADYRKMFEPVGFLSGFPLTAPTRNLLKAFESWETEGDVNLLDAVTGPPKKD